MRIETRERKILKTWRLLKLHAKLQPGKFRECIKDSDPIIPCKISTGFKPSSCTLDILQKFLAFCLEKKKKKKEEEDKDVEVSLKKP